VSARRRVRGAVARAGGLLFGTLVVRALQASGRRVGLALVFHRIEDRQGDPEREFVPPVAAAVFAEQLRWLGRTCFFVPASELHDATRRRRRGERLPVAVTFDDDLETHVACAAPILRAHGVRATFFLTGASLDGPHAFWWERLQRALDAKLDVRPALAAAGIEADAAAPDAVHTIGAAVNELSPSSREELSCALGRLVGPDPPGHGLRAADVRRLVLDGHEIGFHTRRHDPLPSLRGDDAVRSALTDHRDDLARAAGQELRVLSYPNGRADPRIAALALQAGYVAAFTGAPDPLGPDTPRGLIGRLELQHGSAARSAWYVGLRLLGRS